MDASRVLHAPQITLPTPRAELGADVVTRVVRVSPPGSKSLTNRAVLLAALAHGTSTIRGALLDAEDAVVMRRAVEQLGAQFEVDREALRVVGVNGRWTASDALSLDLANAGTAMRFLAAGAWLARVPIHLDGTARMRERPIAELGQLLEQLDCAVAYDQRAGFPPLTITPPPDGAVGGKTIPIGQTQSGQFVSALLLAAAFVKGGLTLTTKFGWTSASYVQMTLALLARLGAQVQASDALRVVRVMPPDDLPGLQGFDLDIEPDASGATYAWAAGALVPGLTVCVPGLCREPGSKRDSLQGDCDFTTVLASMGARVVPSDSGVFVSAPVGTMLRGVDADMCDMPDAVMTLAVVASRAKGPTTIRGVRTLRVKETDRIAALTNELAKVGTRIECPVNGDDDCMRVIPGEDPGTPVSFETYRDHRMAMCLSLLALVRPGVTILDPGCVAKTYPTYWSDFALLAGVEQLST